MGPQSESDKFQLDRVPAAVDKVHFDGVHFTSAKLLAKQVRHLFGPAVSNFENLTAAVNEARQRLHELGVFSELDLVIDVSADPAKRRQGYYDVIFAVQERKRLRMGVSAITSVDNKASLVMRGAVANVTGGAEKLELDWHCGVGNLSEQQRHLTFLKPLENHPSVKFTAGLFDTAGDLSWLKMLERARGGFVGVHWPTFAGVHSLRLEGVWRHLSAATPGVALPHALRAECNHYLRWALKHNFVADGRDDAILPTQGGLAKVRQEVAMGGAGSDQAHVLHELDLQWNHLLREDPSSGSSISLQFTSALGHIRSISENSNVSSVDRFFLGGPLSLRGYALREVGPRTDDAAYPIGGRSYFLSGAHLYSSLPYLGGRGILEHFRLHAFCMAGCITSRVYSNFIPALQSETRLSAGLGLVVRLFGIARFEVNMCWPMLAQAGDKVVKGLQFGVGMDYQ